MRFGYARVSTGGQSLESQLAQLTAEGCYIYAEKISGAESNRPELAKLLRTVVAGDAVVVTRLDRLARSTRDLLNIIAALGERGADLRSLADVWADTTTPHGRLMLTLLGGIAEFERELIRIRTAEGRARAVAAGVRLGRPVKMSPAQRKDAAYRVHAGEKIETVARLYNVSGSTISRIEKI
jgi:DNA invertase Pin-like site-specific DNA recombinase